ncbi:MAG: four helix bundle protein [Acidobacteria bacterium]|nr:four helix bundle protein [Acidobacteriota bacterium]MBI3263851.1 four helix bundle protein [Acidobacteriota bacterium]
MGIKKVQDLLVWQRARAFVVAVSAILDRPGFGKDFKLRSQLANSSGSVLSNIAEGFGQPTDRSFAKYLYIAKASAMESQAHLLVAAIRGYISSGERMQLEREADELQMMLTGLIKYLRASDRKTRG